ncbi:FtsB family cell division protein [Halalkalibacterium ligniniphilum]|uniref:FtsB family cell division protein n=1 Tax=Halalkalibacterium ligniniphilum TaxID=1134413 RepID=UPI00034B85D4|nr:septum formation initiator family protein [Halalkalibacterium ligniniphilum]
MVTKRHSTIRELDSHYVRQHEQQVEWENRKRRGLFRRLLALGLLALILSGVAFVTVHAQASTLEAKEQEKQVLEERLKQLQAEERRLNEDIKNYNDEAYIAEVARRDYYLTKPGEVLFKLPESSSD